MRPRFLPSFSWRGGSPDPRRLPSLIIPGAMKAGTTSLFGWLDGHPGLAASREKEVHYFDTNFHRGAGWYARQFPRPRRTPDGSWARPFESSPYYLYEPRVPARVRRLVPEARIVVLLRDPVDRAFSHYHNNLRLGREELSFEAAIDAEENRLAGEEERMLADPDYVSLVHKRYSYLGRGIYADQLERWLAHFEPSRLLVLDASRLFSDPRRVVAEVLDFLSLEPWEPSSYAALNEGRHGATMRPETRRRLEAFFEPHERRLAGLIGWCPSAARRARAA